MCVCACCEKAISWYHPATDSQYEADWTFFSKWQILAMRLLSVRWIEASEMQCSRVSELIHNKSGRCIIFIFHTESLQKVGHSSDLQWCEKFRHCKESLDYKHVQTMACQLFQNCWKTTGVKMINRFELNARKMIKQKLQPGFSLFRFSNERRIYLCVLVPL